MRRVAILFQFEDVELRELTIGSSEYEVALELRERLLRAPLGLEWTEEERSWEAQDRHFALFEGETMVAVVVSRELANGAMKFRQMAVESARQGEGWGRELLEKAETVLRGEGKMRFELNAREEAVGFYEKLGYEREGERFVEVSIPHWKMVRGVA